MKLDITEIDRRLAACRQRLSDLEQEAAKLPVRGPHSRPADECPRGHKYPGEPRRARTGRRKIECRQCDICRLARSRRMKLRERIKRLEQLRKNYAW